MKRMLTVCVVFLPLMSQFHAAPCIAADDGDKRIQEVQRLTDQMLQLRKDGRPSEAVVVAKKRLALVREILGGENFEAVAGSHELLASMQEADQDLEGAAKSLRNALEIRTQLLGKDHWRVTDGRLAVARMERRAKMSEADRRRLDDADQQMVRAFAAFKAKDYDKAIDLGQQALEIRKQVLGDEAPEVAVDLNSVGFFAQMKKDYPKARALFERELAIQEKVLGDHPDTARTLRALGNVWSLGGGPDEALPHYQRSLKVFTGTLGEDHADSVLALRSVATTLAGPLDDPASAQTFWERLLRIVRKRDGNASRATAEVLVQLGKARAAVGDFAAGRRYEEDALDIYRNKPVDNDVERADCLTQLGLCWRGLADDAKATECLEEAYHIRRDALGEDDVATLESLSALAGDVAAAGDAKTARKRLEQLVAARKRLDGDGRLTAGAIENLGVLLQESGELDDARARLEESLAIWEKGSEGAWAYDRARNLRELALLAAHQERWDEAADRMDQSRRLLRTHLGQALAGLPQAEQLTYVALADRVALQQALSLGLARPDDARTAARSAEWLLNTKAETQEVLAERAVAAAASGDPKLAELTQKLRSVRGELARLVFKAADAVKDHDARIAQLTEEERKLTKEIADAGGRTAAPPGWRDLSQVRHVLPADAVFIDVARFQPYDFQAKSDRKHWLEPHYVAWVIPAEGKGAVRLLDLGEADPIDAAVKTVRMAMQKAPKSIHDDGEVDAEKEVRQPLEALARLVLRPLAPHIDASSQWIISPDASLWLVPWAALPLADGDYAVEKHTIRYVVSGRDLIPPEPFAGKVQPPLVLADPDYDLGIADVQAATREVLAGAELPALRGVAASVKIPHVPRLPATAKEAELIAPRLKQYTGAEPRVCTDRQALEAVFKAVRNPRVVVLSTHGFFMDDPNYAPSDRVGFLSDRGLSPDRPLENPLLRCGLLLAGCNNREQAKEGDEDGVLTGLEIVGTDLRGTDLVVLSACETGLGEVRNGEGVAGLRQAFQLAGARAVAATLWQVEDRSSAQLNSDFFRNLADGKEKAVALRDAQLALIKKRRDANAAAHPFFWAAFTLTGQ